MVIEHTFVTTLDAPEALQAASSFLQERGFSTAAPTAPSSLEMRRGKTNPARARSVAELPQSIRLDFDRGRIGVAVSITPSAAWGGRSWLNSEVEISATDQKLLKRMKLHTDMLMAIAGGLEQVLVHRAPADVAARHWAEAEEHIAVAARRHKRRNIVVATCLSLFVAAIIGLIVYSVRK